MKRTRLNKKFLLIVALLILATVVGFLMWKRNPDDQRSTNDATGLSDLKTYEASSEGSTFPVPDSVPSGSITNYTLVVEEERYKIRQHPDTKAYIITLYAIINRPDQYDVYQGQLREYKQAALDYLKQQGINVNEATITYEPPEAAQL